MSAMRNTTPLLALSVALVGCGSSSGSNGGSASDGGASPDGSVMTGGDSGTDGGSTHTDGGTTTGDGATASNLGPLMGDFIGVNGFIDDPVSLLAPIGNVREYHDWQWSEGNGDASYPGYPNNQNSFSLFGGSWDWDTYYGGLKSMGVMGYPVFQGGVPWLNNGAVPPVASGASTTEPASYAAHADEMFQYAARYGSTTVAPNLLKLASGQTPASGLATLKYIEDWNEEDAWWVLPNDQPVFSTDVYAAMASADRDGDQGRMGATLGAKTADPNIKFVMGGLAGQGATIAAWEHSIETYLDGVQTWATAHRNGDFPADVINAHYYSFGPDASGTVNPRAAVSPEASQVKETMALLRAYRDTKLPGKELWLTEFGYDTDQQSVLHAPPLGSSSAAIVQGQWIVRYYLALLAAGFDRAFLFVSRDSCTGTDAACATQFDTAGLTTVKGTWTPKAAYYFVATFRNRLASLAWLGEATSANANVLIYKFKDPASSKGAYVVWAPTSNATVVSSFSLPIGSATTATAVVLADQQMTGVETTLTPAAGAVTLDVSETPTIVLVDAIE
jgi:hypothetical protein